MVRQAGVGPVTGVPGGVSQNGQDVSPPRRFLVRRLLTVLLAVLAVLAGSLIAPFTGASADNPAVKRVASGWLPYWMTTPSSPQGITSAVQNADLFVDVSPFWYSAVKKGDAVEVVINPNFSNGKANVAWGLGQLKAAGLTVLPAIADGSGKGQMARTLADPAKRTAHVQEIVALVVSNGFDGIDLDYETFAFSDGSSSWAATQPNWTAFVNELSAALRAQGKLLAVTIPPPCGTSGTCGGRSGYWVYDMQGIAPAVDRIRIMAYDYHVHGIGPIAPMPWVRSIVSYSVSVMDPAKLQIGVPTYGRVWTRKQGNSLMVEGTCPSTSSSQFKSLTGMTSVTDANIPKALADVGITPDKYQWSDKEQENWVTYDKKLVWTDGNGAQQTCIAKRIMWWVGPQAVLARTQLVGEFGLNAAAYWTIGGEDPAQWPLIRSYAQSLAPASTDVSATAATPAVFGSPLQVSATVTSQGAPLAGATATLQFRPSGKKGQFTDVASAAVGADGVVRFDVSPSTTGQWKVYVPAVDARTEGVSAPVTVEVLSLVTAEPKASRVSRGQAIVVKAWARPFVKNQRVALEIKNGEQWKAVASVQVNGKGRARLVADAPRQKGKYAYRVVAIGKGGILANASTDIPIRVTK
jgi:spore germination protein YaaH